MRHRRKDFQLEIFIITMIYVDREAMNLARIERAERAAFEREYGREPRDNAELHSFINQRNAAREAAEREKAAKIEEEKAKLAKERREKIARRLSARAATPKGYVRIEDLSMLGEAAMADQAYAVGARLVGEPNRPIVIDLDLGHRLIKPQPDA